MINIIGIVIFIFMVIIVVGFGLLIVEIICSNMSFEKLYLKLSALETFILGVALVFKANFLHWLLNDSLGCALIILLMLLSYILCNIWIKTNTRELSYLALLESFSYSIVLINMVIFFVLVCLLLDSNLYSSTFDYIIQYIEHATLKIENMENMINIYIFFAYLMSMSYIVIKKPIKLEEYNKSAFFFFLIIFIIFIIGPFGAYLFAYELYLLINNNIDYVLLVLCCFMLCPICLVIPNLSKVFDKYNCIIKNYNQLDDLWREMSNNHNNLSLIREIYHNNGISLQLLLGSSAVMSLIISFLNPILIAPYILILSFITYLHWRIVILFKPIYKIEELTIIGENKTIKNAYLIEETDKEYTIIYNDFPKDIILRVPKDSCILKNVKTPLDDNR